MPSDYNIRSGNKLNLLAEINKSKRALENAKVPGVDHAKRQKRDKESQWKKVNKIAKQTAAHRAQLIQDNTDDHNRQVKLLHKEKIYNNLRRGDTSGLTDAQIDTLNVDFERKRQERFEFGDPDRDESLTVPRRPDSDSSDGASETETEGESDGDRYQPSGANDEDLVEVEDEYGRTRKMSRRDADGQGLLSKSKSDKAKGKERAEEEPIFQEPERVYFGDQQEFPVYNPTMEELQERHRQQHIDAPLTQHYDPNSEVRIRGAGQYTFSKDEAERRKVQEAFKANGVAAMREKTAVNEEKDKAEQATADRKRLLAERRQRLNEKRAAGEGGAGSA